MIHDQSRSLISQSAFTLIEVLVALSILAIALAATMRVTAMSTTSAEEVQLRTYATWVAQNHLAELSAQRAFPDPGSQSGETQMAGITFQWQQQSSETPNREFRKVDVRVLLPNDARVRASLTAYLARGGV